MLMQVVSFSIPWSSLLAHRLLSPHDWSEMRMSTRGGSRHIYRMKTSFFLSNNEFSQLSARMWRSKSSRSFLIGSSHRRWRDKLVHDDGRSIHIGTRLAQERHGSKGKRWDPREDFIYLCRHEKSLWNSCRDHGKTSSHLRHSYISFLPPFRIWGDSQARMLPPFTIWTAAGDSPTMLVEGSWFLRSDQRILVHHPIDKKRWWELWTVFLIDVRMWAILLNGGEHETSRRVNKVDTFDQSFPWTWQKMMRNTTSFLPKEKIGESNRVVNRNLDTASIRCRTM